MTAFLKILGLCLLFISFFSSTFAAQSSKRTISSKSKCLQQGGEWGPWSKYEAAHNIERCQFKAKDTGQACQDGKDCSVGLCEYNEKTKVGQCYPYQGRNGCHSWMKDGEPGSKICVD